MNDSEREQNGEDSTNEFVPPRRPVRPILVVGIIALVALIVAGGIFGAIKFAGRNSNAAATPTLPPGSNLFYIQTTPGGGNFYIDGQKLARTPNPTVDLPVQLSAGVHIVSWQNDPFTQKCTIIVPPVLSETRCLANDPLTIPKGPNKGLLAHVITFTASLNALSTAQQQTLIRTAQTALDALQSSETVQPGEHYADLNAPSVISTATTSLRATLSFQLDTNINSPGGCAGEFLGFGSGCSFNGQDCHLFCPTQEGPQDTVPPGRWDVFGIMHATWTYTTLNGQVVAQNQPDETDNNGTEYTVALYITYHGGQWQVATSVPGNTTQFLTSGPSCAAATNAVNQAAFATYSTVNLPGNPNQPIFWNATHASNLAAGCLLTAIVQQNNPATPITNPKPIANCLYRFGVLLALDNATHAFWPNLPLADANEQSIARHIGV